MAGFNLTKTIIVLLLLLEYRCGGGAGDYHSYYNDYEAYGQIRRVEVWAGDVVDGIRVSQEKETRS